jgi:hypothetical protein
MDAAALKDTHTIQVAAFPTEALASEFAANLRRAGEQPTLTQAEIPGRGVWTRVLIGTFDSSGAARQYARRLVSRGLVKDFLVRSSDDIEGPKGVTEAGIEAGNRAPSTSTPTTSNAAEHSSSSTVLVATMVHERGSGLPMSRIMTAQNLIASMPARAFNPIGTLQPVRLTRALPEASAIDLNTAASLAPSAKLGEIPWPDLLTPGLGDMVKPDQEIGGGLWLGGDMDRGLALLRSIAGPTNSRAVQLEVDGRVLLNVSDLDVASRSVESRHLLGILKADGHVDGDDGLLLLVQLTQGAHRFQLYVGAHTYTGAGVTVVAGTLNLDRQFDSRINPRRPKGQKHDYELPPDGFDSLVAINPEARWMNIEKARPVTSWIVIFHELVEAYSKVELGLEYLPSGSRPGAHAVAVQRELKLKSERHSADLVVTEGTNMVFTSDLEMARFQMRSQETGSRVP